MNKSTITNTGLYQQPAQIYDAMMGTDLEVRIFMAVVKEIKKNIKGDKNFILDLCCGTGIVANMLRDLKGIKFVGVDINKNFLRLAKKKLERNKNFSFLLGDAAHYKTNQKFNIVLLTSAYHHIENRFKSRLLKNIRKFLMKDGVLIIYEKAIPPYSNKTEFHNSNKQFYLKRIKYLKETGRNKLTPKQFNALMNICGLSAAGEEEYKVDYNYIMNDLVQNSYKIVKKIKIWPQSNIFKNEKVGDFIFVAKKK